MENKFFRDDMLRSDYAKRSDVSPSWKTWYISHHGVYLVRKSGGICVVFDCSAEFQGTSFNKELLTGPDLTNQIIGVLTRFYEEQSAFMANVESMYYQVQLPAASCSKLQQVLFITIFI